MVGSEIIRTRDGNKLMLSVYKPEKENNSVVVIGPSAYCTQDTYCDLAVFLNNLHYTVITFDYRGTGNLANKNISKNSAQLHQWARLDLDAVLLFAKNTHPEKELIFVAHGISGELTGLAAASQYISRLVLINSALTCAALWPLRGRIRKAIVKATVPVFQFVFGYSSTVRWLSLPRLPKGVMTELFNWCSHDNGVFDVFPDSNYRKLQVPLLSMSFGDDWNSPQKAVTTLLSHFSNAAITWFHTWPADHGLSKIGHAGFFQKTEQDVLWNKLLTWLNEQLVSGKTGEYNVLSS
jgi:predicted alpha/beta hydrolase